MKKFASLLILLACACSFSFANTPNSVVKDGNWNDVSVWSKHNKPADGDTVIVPEGYSLVVNSNLNLTSIDIFLKVEGTLVLENGKLDLSSGSKLVLATENASVQPDKNTPSNKVMVMGVTKYTGQEMAQFGPAFVDGSTSAFMPFAPTALPVKFIHFSVARASAGTKLQWATSEEIGASHYEVERSNDGISWTSVASLRAAGNSMVVNNYTYTDATPVVRMAYYRIRQVDVDGRFAYTSVKTVTGTKATEAVSISATTAGYVLIQFAQEITTPVQVRLVSLSGQVVAQQEYKTTGGQIVMQKSSMAKGAYVVSLTGSNGLNVARQVVL